VIYSKFAGTDIQVAGDEHVLLKVREASGCWFQPPVMQQEGQRSEQHSAATRSSGSSSRPEQLRAVGGRVGVAIGGAGCRRVLADKLASSSACPPAHNHPTHCCGASPRHAVCC
jgi:hypothetical protein